MRQIVSRLLWTVGIGFAIVVRLLARRHPHKQEAPPKPTDATRLHVAPEKRLGRRRLTLLAGAVACLAASGLCLYAGLQLLPPSYVEPGLGFEGAGAIDVYVSDPTVNMELDIVVFDSLEAGSGDIPVGYGLPPGREPTPRMLVWMDGKNEEVVDWAIVLTGGARYQQPLPLPAIHEPMDAFGPQFQDYFGASIRVDGKAQIIEGRAFVGPQAPTNRIADWDGQAVGPFIFRSGSWPTYKSKTVVVLPKVGPGLEDGVPGSAAHLVAPANFDPHVTLAVSILPELLRIDSAEPVPPNRASEALTWSGHGLEDGITVAYADVSKESREASDAVVGGVLLGISATVALSALAFLWRLLRTKGVG